MTVDTRICLMGFGEVGQTLATDLLGAGIRELVAWDVLFDDPSSTPSKRANACGVRIADNACAAVRDAQLVISAVTAAQAAHAARSALEGLQTDAFYLDLNSVSPETKRDIAADIASRKGRFVEGAVMSPIGPKRIASPILLGGAHAEDFLQLAKPLGFGGARVFATEVGRASAAKMCRSVMVKGLEALLSESLLAARKHAVEDTVLRSLEDLLPGTNWRKLAQYMISRSLIHGQRRAEEMREVAQTVSNAGLVAHMSAACAERQAWAAQFAASADATTLEALLDGILDAAAQTSSVPPDT